MKKFISVLLCIALVLAGFSLSVAAMSSDNCDVVLSGEALDMAITAVGAQLADVPVDSIDSVEAANKPESIKAGELAKEFSNYIFVDINKVDEYAELVAERAEYRISTSKDGEKTLYVNIDLRENPELANIDVFREAVKKITDRQADAIAEEDGDVLIMTYQHMAGELAIHTIIAVACSALGISEDNGKFKESLVAELNQSEDRVAPKIINLIGKIIMDYIVTLYVVFSQILK